LVNAFIKSFTDACFYFFHLPKRKGNPKWVMKISISNFSCRNQKNRTRWRKNLGSIKNKVGILKELWLEFWCNNA
jgi:hypothetical protein